MGKIHKSRWVSSRGGVGTNYPHATYSVCGCDYDKDHDDSRSISGQDVRIYGGFAGRIVNDMLRVARREKWDFPPKQLDYLKSWLYSAGDYNEKTKKLEALLLKARIDEVELARSRKQIFGYYEDRMAQLTAQERKTS